MMVTLTKYAHRAIHFWFFSKQPIYDHIDHFQTEFELFSRIKKKLTDDQFGRNCISKGLKKFELSTSFFSFYRKTSHFFLRFRPLLMQNKQTHRNSYKMRCLMSLILISRMGHSQYNWAKSTNLYLNGQLVKGQHFKCQQTVAGCKKTKTAFFAGKNPLLY